MEGLAEEIKTKRDAGRSARLKTSTTAKRPSEHAVQSGQWSPLCGAGCTFYSILSNLSVIPKSQMLPSVEYV